LIWLLRDLDLVSVVLRAAMLSFEALVLGGVAYLWLVAFPSQASAAVERFCRRGIVWAAAALILSEAAGIAASSAFLMGDSGLRLSDLVTANFFLAGSAALLAALLLGVFACSGGRKASLAMLPLSLLLLAAAVSTSHAVARIDHRALLGALTAAHHLGTAAWIGAMPFLLISLARAESVEEARRMVRRYSQMALVSASVLVLAGIGLAWFYVGAWNGLYGTAYGVILLAKIYLLLVMVALGVGNWVLIRRLDTNPEPLLAQLRRFAEAEIGLGFTALLAAASLTAQPPSVDVVQDRVTAPEIHARMHPTVPRLSSPAAAALTPATSMAVAIRDSEFKPMAESDANDRAWSEYNHHWAGLVVLAAGLLALLSRLRAPRWARFWPLTFAGLALFIVLRADPENWPLGPRPFWASFSAPDVLEHRAAALLILCFAAFECAVQAGKLRAKWATLLFPAMCVLGAALLLTHDHVTKDLKEELFAELSHTPIALLGATAGWARWLELRLPKGRAARIAGTLWPLCLAAVGLVLLNYRET
jgi:putative copper resistance protein D